MINKLDDVWMVKPFDGRNFVLETRVPVRMSLSDLLCVRHKLSAKEPLVCHANERKK